MWSDFILPSTIAISSPSKNDRYLNYTDDDEHVSFSGDNVFSKLAKFEVVTSIFGSFVNIRCIHNKKYLQRMSATSDYIVANAAEPNEDKAKWSCTLFEALPSSARNAGADGKARFRHVATGRFVQPCQDEDYLVVPTQDNDEQEDTFDIVDLESLVILPRHVVLKQGDNYLKHFIDGSFKFVSQDKFDPDCWFDVYTDHRGRVQLKTHIQTLTFTLFNREKWISVFPVAYESDTRTFFTPVKLTRTSIALRSLADGSYCSSGEGGSFMACNESAADSALVVEEPVVSRKIYNSDFDLKHAVIYGEKPLSMANGSASNDTAVDNVVTLRLEYKDSTSSEWNSSSTWSVGMEVTATFGIPFIETEVTISGEYSDTYTEGKAVTTESSLETTYTVTVPPHSSVSVSLMATRGKCDVPYSYYQKDLLYNGKTVIYKKDDGVYTGVNSYNFHYVTATTVGGSTNGGGRSLPETVVKKIPLPEAPSAARSVAQSKVNVSVELDAAA